MTAREVLAKPTRKVHCSFKYAVCDTPDFGGCLLVVVIRPCRGIQLICPLASSMTGYLPRCRVLFSSRSHMSTATARIPGLQAPTPPVADPSVSELMGRLCHGSKGAAGQLVSLFYPELRRLAQSQMRGERACHTWQPTVLVNQLYLELLKVRSLNRPATDDRRAFFGLAARLMRRLLIHHARPLEKKMQFVEIAAEDDVAGSAGHHGDLAEVENLLLGLERIDPQFRLIVELKALEGLSMEEIAEQLNIPLRTAYRRWTFARTWLAQHLSTSEALPASPTHRQ